MLEIWKDIVGWEGVYSVSNLGRIRRDKPCIGSKPGHILKLQWRGAGRYLCIRLSDKQGGRLHECHSVHSLVAAAFIGPRPAGLQINHIDGNRINNQASNLEYLTGKQNCLHNYRVLKRPWKGPVGEQVGVSKANPRIVRAIRKAIQDGTYSNGKLAKRFGLGRPTVTAIAKGRTWKHVA